MSWFSSLFRSPEKSAETSRGDPPVEELIAQLGEGLQKLTRVQARQGVRLEEIENKIEGGFSDLRALAAQHPGAGPARQIRWDDLLDAADALDEADRTAVAAGDGSMAEGLRVVAARIGRFLAQLGLERTGRLHAAPDPALVRVVGSVDAPSTSEGHVVRVVRAAVTERGRLLREGEVLVARGPSPPSSPATGGTSP